MKPIVITLFIITFSYCSLSQLTWKQIFKKDASGFYDFAINKSGDLFISKTNGEVIISKNQGKSWNIALKSDTKDSFKLLVNDDDNILAFGTSQGFYLSFDRGSTFNYYYAQIPGKRVHSISKYKKNEYIMIATKDWDKTTVSMSTDRGFYWEPIKDFGTFKSWIFLTNHKNLVVLFDQGNYFYYYSIDDGVTWAYNTYSNYLEYLPYATDINGLTYSFKDDYLGNGVTSSYFYSTKNDSNWQKINHLDSVEVNNIFVTNSNDLLASAKGKGVFLSEGASKAFIKSNIGLDDLNIKDFRTDKFGYIYAFTDSCVYISNETFNETPEQKSRQDINASITPIPVSSDFSVKFNLDKSAPIKLSFYNQIGVLLKVIETGILPEGLNDIPLSKKESGLSPGLYFLKVNTGDRESVLKFIVVN